MLNLLSRLPATWTRRLIHGQGLLRNPYTLGVRVIVEDAQARVLLVRHSYLTGWFMPGGGVDKGETLHDAAVREVREETGIEANAPPALLSVFLNGRGSFGRDHVGLFHLADWSEGPGYLQPSSEILEARFFDLDGLPDTVSPATRQKLSEFREGRIPAGGYWTPAGTCAE